MVRFVNVSHVGVQFLLKFGKQTFLVSVPLEHLAQSKVHDVRRGVIGREFLTLRGIYQTGNVHARLQSSASQHTSVHNKALAALNVHHFEHSPAHGVRRELAGIGNLTTSLFRPTRTKKRRDALACISSDG